MNLRELIYPILVGFIISLSTGIIQNSPSMLMGATLYGYPLPWLIRLVIAPEYFPWRVNTLNLIGDIVIWSIITGMVLFIIKYVKTRL